MLVRNARQLIAADLQAQTWTDPSAEQLRKMAAIGERYGAVTRVTETVSMAASTRGRFPQMVAVKGVDPEAYPYYGKLTVKPAKPLASMLRDDSAILVTPELLMRFKVSPGGTMRLGGKEFRIAGTVEAEPDRLASGFGPGMRVMMSRAGLERTGLVQFGSRAAQRFLFKLRPGVNLAAIKHDMESTIPRVFISDYREGSPVVGRIVDRHFDIP